MTPNSVKPFFLNNNIEESNGNKYLTLFPTDKNKDKLKKYEKKIVAKLNMLLDHDYDEK